MKKYTNKILVITAIVLLATTILLVLIELKNVKRDACNGQGKCCGPLHTATIAVDADGNAEIIEDVIVEE
jgi:hypothetical protein